MLNEQAGGLHGILLSSSSSKIEEGEVTRDEDGTTNLGYENSTFSAASDEDEDESDGTSAKVTAVHEQDDDHCGLGNSTDYDNSDDSGEVSSSTTTKTLWIHPYLA